MKQLKSSHQDLVRLFHSIITVREIAEPLISFESDIDADRVLEFMRRKDFDVVGIRSEGAIDAFVQLGDLGQGPVGKFCKPIRDSHTLSETAPMQQALDALKSSRWVFVHFLGSPGGIITRGDLQKAPMRMWLFGLISLLEMQLLRLIREVYPSDGWEIYLSENRRKATRAFHAERQRCNEGLDLAECLQLGDKVRIFEKSRSLGADLPFDSKAQWTSFAKRIERLRNRLAHSNPIPSSAWPEVSELVKDATRCFKKLEATK